MFDVFVAVDGLLADQLALADQLRARGITDVGWWTTDMTIEQLDSAVAGSRILVTGWRGADISLDRAARPGSRLELLAHTGGSVRGIATKSAFARGIRVTTANDILAESVAEFTIACVLASSRHILWSGLGYRNGRAFEQLRTRTPEMQSITELTVGIVGFGAIGSRVADRLRLLGATLLGYDPSIKSEQWAALRVTQASLLDLASHSDVVSVHVPLTDTTKGMISSEVFDRMRDGAVLVNTARGGLLNESALLAHLKAGRLWAVLDVTDPDEPLLADSEWHALPNCWITPHIGSSTLGTLRRQGQFIADELVAFLQGRPLRGEIAPSALSERA